METSAKNGIKIVKKEIEILTELLMKELLKLDGIEAEGEAKAQRRIEVDSMNVKQTTFHVENQILKQTCVMVFDRSVVSKDSWIFLTV